MIFQVFVGIFSLSFAYGLPLEEYYDNRGGAYPNQQFYYSYQLQPRSTFIYPNDINKPEFHPELGMSPQYHDLVYNYVKDFGGTQSPPHANTYQPVIYGTALGNVGENFGVNYGANLNDKNDKTEMTGAESVEEFTDKPGLNVLIIVCCSLSSKNQDFSCKENKTESDNETHDSQKDYFLPSDYLSLPNHSKSQFYGHFDAIKMKRVNPKTQPTSLPPIGGVISNYVILRDQKNPQNLIQFFGKVKENETNLQHIKRQTTDNSDGVEILAEPLQNSKMSDEVKEESENNKEEEQMDAHPGIAQSKPSAIALAGPGGMAQASPVGTALVGQGGLAVAAPSGTAVAGPAGQGAIPIQIGAEKQKKETVEKNEESDSY